MKSMFFRLAVVSSLVCLSFVRQTFAEVLPAPALHPFGRWLLTDSQQVELIGSAVHFGFRFSGSECRLYAYCKEPGGHNYLQYEIDGVYQGRVRIEGGNRKPVVIKAASPGTHTVWVYKATEATTGPVFIGKVEGHGLQALQEPDAPLIEFIGNSITCGALADPSETPCGTGVYIDQHNAYYAYGPRVARALKANYFLSSVSGIGIYRTWNSDSPSMPQVYEKADLIEGSRRMWDFSQYKPDIVSIALGTNDLSKGDGKTPRAPFDSATFVNAYVRFVQLVKSKYPAAQLVLLSSPMVGGAERQLLQHCLSVVKAAIDAQYPSGRPVALFFFDPMQPRGCSYHPSVEDHALMAAQLEPFFRKLLKE
ncbi:endoglucanase [Puia dinghuensis]|uniref:Endoglucanase n=2 Tax=Puia dinghuensis TaxID=1792502 RepID=A0A8J2U6H8_9BACT|nr:endoglucanase [Puia dinghuensis]